VFLSEVLQRSLPLEVDEVLVRILGETVARGVEDGRLDMRAWGRFGGHLTEDLIGLAANAKTEGALVVAEEESERVLYVRDGEIIGSHSNVLFERLGRVLYQAEVLSHEDADTLIEVEEVIGDAALLDWLPGDVLTWAARRRTESVAAALPYLRHGHFVLVEGTVTLHGMPELALDPQEAGLEARLLYDAWRSGEGEEEAAARPADAPAPLKELRGPPRTKEEELDDLFRRIRDAKLGFN
jgi:hypothetical protein